MNAKEPNSVVEQALIGAPRWVSRGHERAHAMKNRLSVVRALTRLAGRCTTSPAPDLTRTLDATVRELAALIDDVVDESVDGADRCEIAGACELSVPALFETVASRLGAHAEARGVHLRCDCSPASIHGVAFDLAEAVTNLIANALDATPEGGVVTVTTRVTEDGEHAWVIEDSGHGIPHEVLARIGTRRCSRRNGGTGLGLAIAAATIGRHGGMLEVRAEAGAGTRMTAWLPGAFVL